LVVETIERGSAGVRTDPLLVLTLRETHRVRSCVCRRGRVGVNVGARLAGEGQISSDSSEASFRVLSETIKQGQSIEEGNVDRTGSGLDIGER
jgi:hypothetical protein